MQAFGNGQELSGRQPFSLPVEHQAQRALAVQEAAVEVDDGQGDEADPVVVERALDCRRPLPGGSRLRFVYVGSSLLNRLDAARLGSRKRAIDAREQGAEIQTVAKAAEADLGGRRAGNEGRGDA